jgi:ribonucleotide reductase beta subunit family protein with ferritin-like domain
MNDHEEPILNEENYRYTLYPIKYTEIWNLYQKQVAAFWKPSEIDFSKDLDDFITMSRDEQFYIKRILGFFAASDTLVNVNIGKRFLSDIKIMEGLVCYTYQMMMEYQHSESYSIMLDNLVKNTEERNYLLNSIENVESVKKIAEWALKWSDSEKSFAHRLIAFACFEGILFSGAFSSIFWIKAHRSNGKLFLQGLIKSNEFIARDENMHVTMAVLLYKLLEKTRLSQSEVYEIIEESVEIAKFFMSDALPVRLLGMNNEAMADYLEYVADVLLVDLNYSKKYNKKNPFLFMEHIGLSSKTNFFESRPSEYSGVYSMGRVNSDIVTMNDDF